MKGMQKMKRGMALLLVLIMAFGVSFVSTASVQEVQADTVRGIFSNKPEDKDNYGAELMDMDDQTAFKIYDALRSVTTETKTVEVEFDQPLKIAQSYCDQSLLDTLQMALDAFWKDYPEIFWIAGEPENGVHRIQMGYTRHADKDSQGNDIYVVSKVTLTINAPSSYGNLNEAYDAVYQKLTDCTSRAEGLSDYEKLKLYHDFLCDQLSYDHEYTAPNTYDMYGALIGGKCVCEGYAESFKALCDLSGIPCVLVVGQGGNENHMWNYCLVDDKWYAVDVTWDDQEEQTFHEFFLIGSETKTPHFSPDVFSQSHLPNGKFSENGHTFTFPPLSKTAYVSSEEPGPSDPVEPGPADPSEIKVGDVSGDGSIDAEDALMVLQHAAQLKKLENTSLADVDGDTYVTASDALLMLQYAAKLIDHFEAVNK